VQRRDFLLLAVGTAIPWNPAVAAAWTPRIGFIGAGSAVANRGFLDVLWDGLRALGWTDGNLVILDRWAEERTEQLPSIAEELVGARVDVLVTVGTLATLAARRATTTTPTVMVGVGDPTAIGVVESLAHPGGNVTGLTLSSIELIAQRLRLLQQVMPSRSRVAIIVRNDPGLEQKLADIHRNASQMGLDLVELEATSGSALDMAFTRLHNDHCEAIYVASGPLGPAKRARLIALAAESRLPAIYSYRTFAVDGGLMSFAPDDNDLFLRAATFVDKILKGVKPADLPVQAPTKFELVINMKTAKALGLSVPPLLLAQANGVIE
jgi:ABC-type uncharacterized transport system substrate-binding protein